jgi:hypothetical protein
MLVKKMKYRSGVKEDISKKVLWIVLGAGAAYGIYKLVFAKSKIKTSVQGIGQEDSMEEQHKALVETRTQEALKGNKDYQNLLQESIKIKNRRDFVYKVMERRFALVTQDKISDDEYKANLVIINSALDDLLEYEKKIDNAKTGAEEKARAQFDPLPSMILSTKSGPGWLGALATIAGVVGVFILGLRIIGSLRINQFTTMREKELITDSEYTALVNGTIAGETTLFPGLPGAEWFRSLTTLVLIGAGAYLAVKILPGLLSKHKKPGVAK